MLTAGAEEGGALPDGFAANGPATSRAGFSRFTVDQERLGEVAGITILIEEIPQRGTTLCNSLPEHIADLLCQSQVALI